MTIEDINKNLKLFAIAKEMKSEKTNLMGLFLKLKGKIGIMQGRKLYYKSL